MLQTTTYKETPDFFGVDYTKKGIATKVRINYTTFGSPMPGRTQAKNVGGYLYSHNGQEKDNEIFDGALSAEFWEYDARLGRRWEMDPIIKVWESPYATFGNNPIYYSDVKGLDKGGKNKSIQPKFGKGPRTKKEQRKINRAHRKHERWTRRRERAGYQRRQERTDHPKNGAGLTIKYHNNLGGEHNPSIWNLPGSHKKYYNSKYSPPDEPNNGLDITGKIKGNTSLEFQLMKQKIREMPSDIHWEAPTYIEMGTSYQFKHNFDKKGKLAIVVDASSTVGIGISSLVDIKGVTEEVKGSVTSPTKGVPGQDQYSLVSINGTLGTNISFVLL